MRFSGDEGREGRRLAKKKDPTCNGAEEKHRVHPVHRLVRHVRRQEGAHERGGVPADEGGARIRTSDARANPERNVSEDVQTHREMCLLSDAQFGKTEKASKEWNAKSFFAANEDSLFNC